MRAAADMPGRRRRSRDSSKKMSGRGRIILIFAALAIFLLVTSLRGIASFYTDYLWFKSLDLSSVFTGILGAKVALGAIFTGVFAAICFVNLTIADRIAPAFQRIGPEDELLNRYNQLVGKRALLLRAGVSLLLGLVAGVGQSSAWNQWILFRNGGDFGVNDATFGTDVGFYVFRLPFYVTVVTWLFASLVIILFITLVAHYLNGGIRLQAPFQRVTPAVKGHISVLLAVSALVKAVGYWLQRYELTFSTRGVVDGATYTSVKAQLPVIYLLLLISLLSCALFIVNIWRRGWVLPIVAVGLWGFVAVVAGAAYPEFIQRFMVVPAESVKERPYIENNIAATRLAMGLDRVETKDFNYTEDSEATAKAIQESPQTVRNIRLLDPNVVLPTYQRQQSIRAPYRFNELDVDRYMVKTPDGDYERTTVVLGNRDMSIADIPQQSWEGRHLTFTHGYGMALAPANATTSTGLPKFMVRDIPVQVDEDIELEINQPQLYFGENIDGYAVVGTKRQEIDLPDGNGQNGQNAQSEYEGKGGVPLNSWLRKAAFAARFGDWNPLISSFITDQSQILYIRDIKSRISTAAPFLRYDSDPYPVVVNGRIVYLVDAYTTTDHYPNAQRIDTTGLPADTGLTGQFNYVRNSVKGVVDAYDGTVKLYVVDPADPIAQAYQTAFPELFAPMDEMPAELRDHVRYPEDLFRVQTSMWGRYHIDNPDEFYAKTSAWSIAQDPGTAVATAANSTTPTITSATGEVSRALEPRVDPYYLMMRLPDESRSSFLLLRSFVPISDDDSKKQLTAFMVAKSDPDDYGRLVVYQMPRDQSIDGPAIVNSTIQADDQVAQRITILNQQGSRVLYGNLLLIPIENSILYVRPLYVSSEGQTTQPELKNVIVVFGSRVIIRPTLREALMAMFPTITVPETYESQRADTDVSAGGDGSLEGDGSGDVEATEDQPTTTTTTVVPDSTPPTTSGEPSQAGTPEQLVAQAQQMLISAEADLRATGDLGAYQTAVREAIELLRQASEAMSTTTTTAASPSTPTTEPPASA